MALVSDAQFLQRRLPGFHTRHHMPIPATGRPRLGELTQGLERSFRQRLLGHVGQRRVIDRIVVLPGPQQAQKVDPALAVGAGEVGEQLVANVSTVAVVARMARTRVVDLNVLRALQRRLQQGFLLAVKVIVTGRDQGTELPGGDLEAPLLQLLE